MMLKYLFTALLCLCLVGYANAKTSAKDSTSMEDTRANTELSAEDSIWLESTRLCIPVKHTEEFYYAPCTEGRFVEALNRFIDFHPKLRLKRIVQDLSPDKKYTIFLIEPR